MINLQVIPYEMLQRDLDIPTVRQLEDFIITECFYSNVIEGKLDQRKASLQVGQQNCMQLPTGLL